MLSNRQDAYGRIIADHTLGVSSPEIIERDDGWVGVSSGASAYFAQYASWPKLERDAIRHAKGRCLDVGCGAGRVSLHLQSCGHEVVAIDNSPLAVKVARKQGVRRAHVVPFTQISPSLGKFDTIVMYGNNFGLFGGVRRARWLLRRLRALTSADARIIAESRNPYAGASPEHRSYHRLNRARGRLAGQLRIRVRSGTLSTPWFDYLLVSPTEMKAVLAGTGWQVTKTYGAREPVYLSIVEKLAI